MARLRRRSRPDHGGNELTRRPAPGPAAVAIDAFARSIERRLRGPATIRAQLLDEMKDHLDESVAALTAAGVPEAEAAARAVSAFGRPERVASDFQTELARHQTARFALGLMTLPPVLTLLWMTILTTGPQAPWTESGEPIQLAWMDLVGSTAMKVALIVAIAANLAFWLPARARVARGLIAEGQRWATHLSVCGAATLGLSLMTILGYVAMRVYLAPWSLEWLDISVGTIITVGVLAALATRTRVTWQHFRASHLLATRAAE